MPNRSRRSDSPHREAARHLSTSLRRARIERGWSQQKLAQASGVSIGTVRAIETSVVVDPGIFTVVSLARAMEMDLSSLVPLQEHMPEPWAE